jgi:homogentisate 1,2-dioxygenase
MPYYRCVGDVPKKRHTRFRSPDGSLYAEELMGAEGFSSDSALLYHQRSPSALAAVVAMGQEPLGLEPNRPLLPRHLRTGELDTGDDPITGRQSLLGNDDVVVSFAASAEGESALYRNAVGDELVFVQSGSATLETVFGALAVGAGDYVVIPTGTTHRWAALEPLSLLVIETSGHVRTPRRYLSPTGQFLEHAPYCERDLRAPAAPLVVDHEGEVDVIVKHRGGLSRHRHCHHPFDVVGWDGCLYPYAFNIADFEPIVGSIHQPPPVHQTFELPNAVVCSFVPRLYDFHPDAVKVPYHHANVDSDEVLFYSQGDFMSRAGSGVGLGSITLHPAGFVHGPQPGSVERSVDKERTDETAVMLDTFRPLSLTPEALAVADDAYAFSWSRTP